MRFEIPLFAMTKSLVTGPGTASGASSAFPVAAAPPLAWLPLPATSCKQPNAPVSPDTVQDTWTVHGDRENVDKRQPVAGVDRSFVIDPLRERISTRSRFRNIGEADSWQ